MGVINAPLWTSTPAVAVAGDYAFTGCTDATLRVASIADKQHPVEVGFHGSTGIPSDIVVSGGYVYVGVGAPGLQIYQFYGAGVEETMNDGRGTKNVGPTILSGSSVHSLGSRVAFDAMGRRVLNPRSGIFFVRGAVSGEPSAVGASAVRKVVVTR